MPCFRLHHARHTYQSLTTARLAAAGDLLMPLMGPMSLKQHGGRNYAEPNDPALLPMREGEPACRAG